MVLKSGKERQTSKVVQPQSPHPISFDPICKILAARKSASAVGQRPEYRGSFGVEMMIELVGEITMPRGLQGDVLLFEPDIRYAGTPDREKESHDHTRQQV